MFPYKDFLDISSCSSCWTKKWPWAQEIGQASATPIRTSRNAARTSCFQTSAVKLWTERWKYMMTHAGGNTETTQKQSWETALHQKVLRSLCPRFPSKLARTPEMLRWAVRRESPIFQVAGTWIKSLYISTCLLSISFENSGQLDLNSDIRLWCLSHNWHHWQLESWFQESSNCLSISISPGHNYQVNGQRSPRRTNGKIVIIIPCPRVAGPFALGCWHTDLKLSETNSF